MIGLLTIGLIGLALCKKRRVSGIGVIEQISKKELDYFYKNYILFEKEYKEIKELVSSIRQYSSENGAISNYLKRHNCKMVHGGDYIISFIGPSKKVYYSMVREDGLNTWKLQQKIRIRVDYKIYINYIAYNYLEAKISDQLGLLKQYKDYCNHAGKIVEFIDW